MERAQLLIAALLLVGVLGTGLGAYYYTSTSPCSPYYLSVTENPGGYDDAPVREFSALTDAQQQAFERALETSKNEHGWHRVATNELLFDQPVKVDYEGQRYLVTSLSNDGCVPLVHTLVRVLPLGLGLVSLVAGVRARSRD